MDFRFGDSKKVLANRRKFFVKLSINPNLIAEITQVHGNKVLAVNRTTNPQAKADGLITNKKNLFLMLKIADCMPIGFYDPEHLAIGLIHAGYKGLEKGIIKKTINEIKQNFETNPKDLIVKFSPSIGPCHYKLDIWKEAENQLISCGILKENIDNPKICTYESSDHFSHRRSEDSDQKEGRFVTILGIKM